jgi:quercetin dioxygenase-like cupin family protein
MYMTITSGAHEFGGADTICVLRWTGLANMGDAHPAGQGDVDTARSADLVFVVSKAEIVGPDVYLSQRFTWPDGPALVRLDEVCFPVDAIASRHTHCGSGFRHLVRGGLRIETGTGETDMAVGDSWFEPADTPVRAVSTHTDGVTSFVRCMVIPATHAGKTTFKLVDPADAALPRLQVTHQHLEHAIYVEAG